jgi:ClpP class serine protease
LGIKSKFSDIRAVIPQLAMSAGTMIACSANKIIMGKHSSLGPVDPQINVNGMIMAAHGVIEEFSKAFDEIKEDQSKLAVWQFILSKYNPTFLGECQKVVIWSKRILIDNLKDRMLIKDHDKDKKAKRVEEELCNHSISLSHSRHLSSQKCKDIGLVVEDLEKDQKLQDLVLSLHHTTMQTLMMTPACKIIENHNGQAFIQAVMLQKA